MYWRAQKHIENQHKRRMIAVVISHDAKTRKGMSQDQPLTWALRIRYLPGRIASACVIAILILCFSQCATPVSPKGGPKDLIPPEVVVDESTQNPMTNFALDEIRITLNEWVQLKDAATQIIISPPIEPRPFPKLDRKTVVIPIDPETILDNTTYTINFGESIVDITERNPLLNHTFVFSKGSYVDSLSVRGVVINAHTGVPEPGARFILHDNPSDTAISTVLPTYFSTTDDAGKFQLSYLRADTFRGYVIKEAEFGNYRYDVGEQLGFIGQPIILNDTATMELAISIYLPRLQLRAIYAGKEKGAWIIALTRESSFIELGGDTASLKYWDHSADTIKLWHVSSDTLQIEVLEAGLPIDTIEIGPYLVEDERVSIFLTSKRLHPDDHIVMASNTPLVSVDSRLVRVAQGDSTDISSFNLEIDHTDRRNTLLKTKWIENAGYYVTLLPGAVTDIYGNSNDTVQFVVSIDERVNFGILNLTFMGFDSTVQYIVNLMDNETEVQSRVVNNTAGSVLAFNRLPAKAYVAKIIEDTNANGVWDTGDLELKRQPERIFMKKLDGMRPGWDLDLTITWPKQ